MRNNNQQIEDAIILNTTRAAAAASQTPFKTAFNITMGIFAAQLVAVVAFFTVIGLFAVSMSLYFSK